MNSMLALFEATSPGYDCGREIHRLGPGSARCPTKSVTTKHPAAKNGLMVIQ